MNHFSLSLLIILDNANKFGKFAKLFVKNQK